MSKQEFVYTIYIRTTPEKLWSAITTPEFTRQYWGGFENISDWKKSSAWKHVADDEKRTVRIVGEVLESVPPKRLVLSWADPSNSSDSSSVTFEISSIKDLVCLSIFHGNFKADSEMAGKVAIGWPRVLSSLKSFLETGEALDVKGMKGESR